MNAQKYLFFWNSQNFSLAKLLSAYHNGRVQHPRQYATAGDRCTLE
jgi:hypothetical protein